MLDTVINLLNATINQLVNDFNFIIQNPKHNKLHAKVKENQIANLNQVLNYLNNVDAESKQNQAQTSQQIAKLKTQITKLEGCLLYYGVTFDEISFFCSRTEQDVINLVKETLQDNAYYIPIKHTQTKSEPVIFATKPAIPFNELLNLALRHGQI